MGLLTAEEWRSRWIADAGNGETVLLRREFEVKPGLRRALVHLSGLGQYELQVNGAAAQDDLLSPGWTKYDKTCLYDTRDLTPLVRPGRNALGLFLGNGMYRVHAGRYTKFTGSFGQLMAILHLRLEYADGTVETIGSDSRWRSHAGPITFSSIYGGEDFDARLDPKGWSAPGFDDRDWQQALEVGGPGGLLKGQTSAAPPIRTFEALPRPRAIASWRSDRCLRHRPERVAGHQGSRPWPTRGLHPCHSGGTVEGGRNGRSRVRGRG